MFEKLKHFICSFVCYNKKRMKHIIPSFLALCLFVTIPIKQSSAQCVPSLSACTLAHPGDPLCMVPDSNQMPPGYVGVAYDRCIRFIFENSFTVTENPSTGQQLPFPVTASLGYMTFDSIGGLPPGISYTMTSGNPLDPPGRFTAVDSAGDTIKAYGCIHLFGTPTQANTAASDTPKIYTKPHGCVLGGTLCGDFPWPIVYRVPIYQFQGIEESGAPVTVRIVPQRSNNSLQVQCDAITGAQVKFSVIDIVGKTLIEQYSPINAGRNELTFNFSAASGFYILLLTTDHGISSRRFVW
jgi:hypothetical protein